MSKRKNLGNAAAKRAQKPSLDDVMYGGGTLPEDFFAGLQETEQTNTQIVVEDDGARIGAFKLTPIGAAIDDGVTEAEWWAFWEVIGSFESAIQWIIGDALVYGDLKLGKTYEDVAERLERYSQDTLRQYAHVARSIPMLIRINGLSFAHHQVVAGTDLTEAARQEYLIKAAERGWSVSKLRQEIKGQLPPSKRPAWQKRLDSLEQTYTRGRWTRLPSESRREAYERLRNLLDQMETWGLED